MSHPVLTREPLTPLTLAPAPAPAPAPIDLRVLAYSNASHVQTGYGVQTKLLLRIMKRLGMTPAEFGFYGLEGALLYLDGHPSYPKGYNAWGEDIAGAHADHFQADVIVALLDSWVLNLDHFGGRRLALYAPVDHDPIPQAIAERLRRCWLPIMYSQFAVQKCLEQNIPVAYAPHSIDAHALQPANRREARAALGWPQDRPILVTVAANKGYPSRKNWPQMIKAFAEARKRHPDLIWYCHTTTGERGEMQGVNLLAEAERHGVRESILFPNQYQIVLGHPDEYMRAVYSAADLFYLASGGEGFGVPLWESLACGTPVLTTAVTAQQDLLHGGAPGWYLPEEVCERFPTPLHADQYIPQHRPLVELLVEAVDAIGRMTPQERTERITAPARRFAEQYHWEVVADQHWRPIFQQMAQRIAEEGRMQFAGQAQHQRDIDASRRIPAPADRYAHWLNRWSDIQTHLPTLFAQSAGVVVELGTRSGVSTAAILAGVELHGGVLYSVDLDPQSGQLFSHPQWRFLQGSSTDHATLARVMQQQIAPGQPWHACIDLLFVDTEHTYAQVTAELALWAPCVRPGGLIAFHDTESFPEVRQAVDAFCEQHGYLPVYLPGSNGLGLVRIPHPETAEE